MSQDDLLKRIEDIENRLSILESDADGMPAYANPKRYFRVTSKGKSLDGLGSERVCPACGGEQYVPHIGEYETVYEINGKDMRRCPLCRGNGIMRDRLSEPELEELAKS